MLSSGKTHQITRQKNIDLASVSRSRRRPCVEQRVASKLDDPVDDDMDEGGSGSALTLDEDIDEDYLATVAAAAAAALSDDQTFVGEDETNGHQRLKNEIELINESLSKLTTRLIADDPDACYHHHHHHHHQFDFNSSTIAAINATSPDCTNTPSTSSSSSSPSNLPVSSQAAFLSTPEHHFKTNSNRSLNSTGQSSESSSSASVSPAPFASGFLPPAISLSPTLKPIRPHNQPPTPTTPTTSQRRLSKSPNGKQLVATNSVPIVQPKPKRLASLMRLSSNGGVSFFSRSCPGDDIADGAATGESQSGVGEEGKSAASKSKTTPETPATRTLGKSFFAFAARASKAVKKSSVESNSSASNTSSQANLNEERSEFSSRINGIEVDMEKLARELILPSLSTPLTSFKHSSQDGAPTKPPLQSSKTMDANSSPQNNPKKRTFIRSLTAQNK